MAARRFRGQWGIWPIRLQETARDEENFQLVETITLADNGIIVLRCSYPHAHSLRQLGSGEFFDDACYPLASLDENVDPLVLVGSVSIALGVVTANSHSR